MARISLSQIFNQGLRGILNVQAQSANTQNQIATGKRVLTPSDDPVSAARILQIEQQQNGITQYQKNIDGVESNLMLEETQLDAVANLLVRVRELAIQSGSGALDQSGRQAVAAELATRLDELKSLANTRNSSGEYIFGGFQGEQAPFVETTNGTFTYRGDEGQRLVRISDSTSVPTGDNGRTLFEAIPMATVPAVSASSSATISSGFIVDRTAFEASFNGPDAPFEIELTVSEDPDSRSYIVFDKSGAPVDSDGDGQTDVFTYAEGEKLTFGGAEFRIVGGTVGDTFQLFAPSSQGMLDTVARLANGLASLGDGPNDKLRLQDLVAETLSNLENAEDNVGIVRSQVGARLNTLDSTRELHSGVSLVNDKILSEIRDLDYAEAITRLTQENFVLQAAQQGFAQISKLSLFNFLR